MRIYKLTGNDCGGFRPPKGHLDTQMYPECDGTETDRNIVKKTVEKRKKKKQVSAMHWPLITHDAKGIWERWKNKSLDDSDFVKKMDQLRSVSGFPGVPDLPLIRDIINNALDTYRRDRDIPAAARTIGMALGTWLQLDKEEQDETTDTLENFNLSKARE